MSCNSPPGVPAGGYWGCCDQLGETMNHNYPCPGCGKDTDEGNTGGTPVNTCDSPLSIGSI